MSDNYNNDMNTGSVIDDTVSGVEKAPKKKTGTKIAAIGIGAVVLVGGGGAIAYNVSDFVKNKVKLATLAPEEYYAWVTEKSAADSAKSISEAYQKYIDQLGEGASASAEFKYDVSDSVKEMLIDSLFGSSADESEEAQNFLDVINNLNSLEIGVNASAKSGITTADYFIGTNGDKLVSADFAMDSDALSYYMRVPQLTEKWLELNLDSLMQSEYNSLEETAMLDLTTEIMKNPEGFLTAKELEEIINKYTAVWYGEIDDVELEKKEKVNIGDISVDYTVITAEIDGNKAYDVAKAFLKEASEDKLIKEIVTERLAVCAGDEYDEFLSDALASLEEGKDNGRFDDDDTVELLTYVDAKGTIRGMSVKTNYEDEEISYIIGLEGDNVYGTLNFSDGYDRFTAELNAIKKGKSYTGDIDVRYKESDYDDYTGDEWSFSVEFSDFEIVDEEMGYVNGNLTVIIPDISPIKLDLKSDGKSQDIIFDLNIDGTDYGKFTLTMSSEKIKDISMPDVSNKLTISSDDDFDIENYVTEDDITNFITDLFKKLGFNDEISGLLTDSISSGLFNDYTYDDDYDFNYTEEYDDDWDYDDDDYDWDWDDDDYDWDDAEPNPDAANAVEADTAQAYINVMDYDWYAEYWGDTEDSLAYKAGVATITGNGQYTVSVTADTNGYRFDTTGDVNDNSVLPDGLDYLSICIVDGIELFPDAVIKVDSIKFDGKDIALTGTPFTINDYETECVIYCDWFGDIPSDARCADGDTANITATSIDGESIGNWTTIEITFTVSGI